MTQETVSGSAGGPNPIHIYAIAVDGLADTEGDAGPASVRLQVDARTRATGMGRLDLEVRTAAWRLVGRDLIWLVTTNKGWVHLRGTARLSNASVDQPIRLDVCSDASTVDGDPDRIALRLYPPGSDPNLVSPVVKLVGVFDGRAVHLGSGTGRGTNRASRW